jgi:hypothetical protein
MYLFVIYIGVQMLMSNSHFPLLSYEKLRYESNKSISDQAIKLQVLWIAKSSFMQVLWHCTFTGLNVMCNVTELQFILFYFLIVDDQCIRHGIGLLE